MRISSIVLWDGNKPREVPVPPIVQRAGSAGWDEAKPEYKERCPFVKGQPVTAAPVSDGIKYDPGGSHLPRPTPGEVLAVHPEGRWVMVLFQIGMLHVRECFRPWEVRPRISDKAQGEYETKPVKAAPDWGDINLTYAVTKEGQTKTRRGGRKHHGRREHREEDYA